MIVVVVGPDPASAGEFRRRAPELGLDHVTVVNAGASHKPPTPALLVDWSRPATNLVAGTVVYHRARRAAYEMVEVVPVRRLDLLTTDNRGYTYLRRSGS